MKKKKSDQNSIKEGQIISTPALDGPSQMASDVMMLEKISQGSDLSITFRLYKWEGIWLSIGRHQKQLPEHWINLVKNQNLKICRRPSGGSAVLHSGGITYSLAWQSPPTKRHEAYKETTKWLIDCFRELEIPLIFGKQPSSFASGNCFSSSTHADLIDENGCKRIGSAQFWRNGSLLQHGEILLDPPKELWIELFQEPPPNLNFSYISKENLEDLLKKSLIKNWPKINWCTKEFLDHEKEKIDLNSKTYLVN